MGLFSGIKNVYQSFYSNVIDVVYDAWKDVGDWLVDELISKEGPLPDNLLVNNNDAVSSLPVVYGERRLGGTRVYLVSSGSKNKYLNSILAIAEGAVNGISDIEINDKPESAVTSKLRYTKYLGATTQAADAQFVSELTAWTSEHTLNGVAYLALRYEYDQDTYSGLPTATSLVKGLSLYDPRTATSAYSTNYALVVLDYFRSAVYGVGITDDSLIDFESFKSSANTADSEYASSVDSEVMVKRFACNTVVDTSKSPLDNIKELVSESRGFLTNSAGQWRYIIQNDTTSNHTITFDDIVGSISRQSNGARDKYNKVTVKYVDPDLGWSENEATYPLDNDEYETYLEEDNFEESHQDISVSSCTNRYQAIDIARQALQESRIGGGISFEGQPWLIKVRVGDLITMAVPGLADNYLYRVSSRSLPQTGGVSIQGIVYDPSVFPWIDIPDQTAPDVPVVVDASFLPDPTSPTFTADEFNIASAGVLKWTQSDSAFVKDYQVEVYRVADNKLVLSTAVPVVSGWADDYQPSVMVPYLESGAYLAQIRARNTITRSNAVDASFQVAVPILDKVTGLTLLGEFDSELVLSWDDINLAALSHYRIDIINVDTGGVLASQSSPVSSVTLAFSLFKSLGFIRRFDVRVYALNVSNQASDFASLAITKNAPSAPADVQVWAGVDELKFTFTATANSTGVVCWLSTVSPVEQTDSNQIYSGSALSVTASGLSEFTQYHLSIVSYDAFGVGPVVSYVATTMQDAVAQSIQQLTQRDLDIESDVADSIQSLSERDLSIESDVKALAQLTQENAVKALVNQDDVAEAVLNAAAASAKADRVQLGQNDEYYRILNAVVEIDPASGVIVSRATQYTNNKFSEAELLIDAANEVIELQVQRITTAENNIVSANGQIEVLAGEMNLRATYTDVSEAVAGAIDAIQPSYVTNFYSGLDGWSALTGTVVFNAGQYLDLTLGDVATSLNFDGAENPVIQLVLSRDPAASWAGKVQYQTAGHGYSSSYELPINEITADGLQYTVIVDFSAVADYTANTVTGLRIVLGNTVSDVFTLHSVQAGKKTAAQTALEGLQGRVTTAEQSINAVEGTLDQYVKTTWFNDNTLTESNVNSILNSWDSTWQVLATLTELTAAGTVAKANAASVWIGAADAHIESIASAYIDNGVGSELTEVKQILDAQAGVSSEQIVSISQVSQAVTDTEEALLLAGISQASADREQVAQFDSIAVAKKEINANATEQAAQAQSLLSLQTETDDNKSAIEQEATARTDADTAFAQSMQLLQTETDDNKSAIEQEATTRTDADTAFAQSMQLLQAETDDNKSAIELEVTTRTDVDTAFAQSMQLLQTETDDNKSAIEQETTTRTDADMAFALSMQSLQTETDDNKSAIEQEATTRTDADTALAQSISQLSTEVGDNKASVDEYQRAAIGFCVDGDGNVTSHETAVSCELIEGNSWTSSSIAEAFKNVSITAKNAANEDVTVSAGSLYQAIVDEAGKASATATLLALVNGQLAGVFANVGDDGSTLEFIANSMKFKTANGTATPFEIIGNQVFAKELIVQAANLAAASVKTIHIEDGAIDSAKVGDLESLNYVEGQAGWKINRDGSAEFNGAVISRELSVLEGVYDAGRITASNQANITQLKEFIVDTGYPGVSWAGTAFYITADAGFTSSSVNANSATLSETKWGVTCDVLPITKWSTAATVHVIIKVWGQRLNYIDPCKIKWRLLRVS